MPTTNTAGPSLLERRSTWVAIFLLALLLRLVFMLLADNNGTDAYVRLQIAQGWVKNPSQLPSEVWLPLHFWLLGASLWIWNAEWSARLLTVLLGALTVPLFGGFCRRIYGERVASYSMLALAAFGLHVGYSMTTSSEAPTMFFLVAGLYAWSRWRDQKEMKWLALSGLSLSAACLIRFDVWFFPIVMVLLLPDYAHGVSRALTSIESWQRMISFGLFAFLGTGGWLLYSLIKWGDLFYSPRTAFLNVLPEQSLVYRLVAVPGVLIVTLTPLLPLLALWAPFGRELRTRAGWGVPVALLLTMGGAQYYTAVFRHLTLARYTLMYSWLIFPLAFFALESLAQRWPALGGRRALAGLLILFVLWQGGVVVAAYTAPDPIASKLASVSPTLPLPPDVRGMIQWLKANRGAGEAIILDDFNFEGLEVIRFGGVERNNIFALTGDDARTTAELPAFLDQKKPRWLLYAPRGRFERNWPIQDAEESELAALRVNVKRVWARGNWRIYEIQYTLPTSSLVSTSAALTRTFYCLEDFEDVDLNIASSSDMQTYEVNSCGLFGRVTRNSRVYMEYKAPISGSRSLVLDNASGLWANHLTYIPSLAQLRQGIYVAWTSRFVRNLGIGAKLHRWHHGGRWLQISADNATDDPGRWATIRAEFDAEPSCPDERELKTRTGDFCAGSTDIRMLPGATVRWVIFYAKREDGLGVIKWWVNRRLMGHFEGTNIGGFGGGNSSGDGFHLGWSFVTDPANGKWGKAELGSTMLVDDIVVANFYPDPERDEPNYSRAKTAATRGVGRIPKARSAHAENSLIPPT